MGNWAANAGSSSARETRNRDNHVAGNGNGSDRVDFGRFVGIVNSGVVISCCNIVSRWLPAGFGRVCVCVCVRAGADKLGGHGGATLDRWKQRQKGVRGCGRAHALSELGNLLSQGTYDVRT